MMIKSCYVKRVRGVGLSLWKSYREKEKKKKKRPLFIINNGRNFSFDYVFIGATYFMV